MADTNKTRIKLAAVEKLGRLYTFFESGFLDAEQNRIAAMPIEEVEEGLRRMGLDPAKPLPDKVKQLITRKASHPQVIDDETLDAIESYQHPRDIPTVAEGETISSTAETHLPLDPLIGRVLDSRYELISRLGTGGMGSVYKARRIHLDDYVAVKVLHPQYASEKAVVERFRREAVAAARFRHDNVVTVYDFGTAGRDAPAFIAMELVGGESLRVFLQREKFLPVERAIALMLDICAGVGAAHHHNIVHRDLKPENIMVLPAKAAGESEKVKVLDFGVAKLKGLTILPPLTQMGALIGTPYYMSPEQCRGESLNASSDVYSLGVILYEMITGKPPFTAETIAGVILKHMGDAPPPLPLDISPALGDCIMHALAKEPSARQQDAFELARQLCLFQEVGELKTTISVKNLLRG